MLYDVCQGIMTLFLWMLKANKRQKLMQSQTTTATEDLDEDLGHGNDDTLHEAASDDSEGEEEGHHQAAAGFTLDLGAAPGGDTKFRDDNFYLGYDRGDNRYAEEGFAVGGRGEEMVLDLAGDENVSLAGMTCCAAGFCAIQEYLTIASGQYGIKQQFSPITWRFDTMAMKHSPYMPMVKEIAEECPWQLSTCLVKGFVFQNIVKTCTICADASSSLCYGCCAATGV